MLKKAIIIVFVLVYCGNYSAYAQVDKEYNYEYALIEANRQKSIGNIQEALNLYKKCLEVNQESGIAAYEIGNIYRFLKKMDLASNYYKKAYEKDEENFWYRVAYIEVLKLNKEYKEAIKIIRETLKKKEDSKLRYNLAVVYHLKGKERRAIKTLNLIEKEGGISEMVILEKLEIFKSIKEYDKGKKELEKLLTLMPESPEYQIIMAEYMDEIGNDNEAVKYFEKAFSLDSANIFAITNLADYYTRNSNIDKSIYFLNLAFKFQEIKLENKIKTALFYLNNEKYFNDYNDGLEMLIKTLLDEYEGDEDVMGIAYDFYFKSHQYDKSYNIIKEIVKKYNKNYIYWQQAIYNASLLNKPDEIIELSIKAEKFFPNKKEIFMFRGIAKYQKEKYYEAYRLLKDNFEEGFSDDVAKQYLTFLGESAYKINLKEEAFKYFEELILLDPDNIMVLNNYSYYLSLENIKLERAEKLSKKTIEAEENNPIYLDTYGWILFKLNRYDEALKYVEKATVLSNDSDVLYHYAEILLKMGDKKKAVIYFKKAGEMGYNIEEINRKIDLCL